MQIGHLPSTRLKEKTKNLYLAQMKWCEREQPICVGKNKKKVSKEALRILKEKNGHGLVWRGQAGCSVKITYDDIEILSLPLIS